MIHDIDDSIYEGQAGRLLLGIDTGGTYTDAVLLDAHGAVLAEGKALTTRDDLAVGIREALEALPAAALPHIGLVGLSTTLATNAIVEGQGAPVCLLLAGYDRELIDRYAFWPALATRRVAFIRGGHTAEGDEKEPLDLEAARQAILEQRGQVQAFAISGYFGVRNPAHELELQALVQELSGLPCTCGHELTSELDSIRRATTTALNARLIPILEALIRRVQEALAALAVHAPLMVVRGDGSLMQAQMALERPVETILSGPAASAVGAHYLSGAQDILAVDMGGTTTDIVFLEGGQPRLSAEGAHVGHWRTMVRAADVGTLGLGGDSQVQVVDGELCLGPRRVIPLSYLASQRPAALAALQAAADRGERAECLLLLRQEGAAPIQAGSSDGEILAALQHGPLTPNQLARALPRGFFLGRTVERLEGAGLVARAGFTPTDALHVLGRFCPWSVAAAQAGASLLAARAGLEPDELCRAVIEAVSDRAVEAIVAKLLEDEDGLTAWPDGAGARALLRRAVGSVPESVLGCRLTLRRPLVAIGAPVDAYMPRAADKLGTELLIPQHAAVANAVGAVVGSVVQVVEAKIAPLGAGPLLRLHVGHEVRDFDSLEAAVARAMELGSALARERALRGGAKEVEVHVERQDHEAEVAPGWGSTLYLGTDLRFTATGRPAPICQQG